jgi:hypothetical protein
LKKLQNALTWINFSIDMWTSPAKKAFQAIVVHWADAETRRIESALLSLKEFKGSRGGEEQARVFLEVIKEAGLQNKIGFFTMDNHGSNDKMLHHIAKEIENFDPILRRVRCYGHNLNLAVLSYLARQGTAARIEQTKKMPSTWPSRRWPGYPKTRTWKPEISKSSRADGGG